MIFIVLRFLRQKLIVDPQEHIQQLLKILRGEEENEIFFAENHMPMQHSWVFYYESIFG